MTEWDVFQADVLDVLNQYEGYFDLFERVGNLSDNSRPDCFGKIAREDKKEVWVVDAKNKAEIDQDDLNRMEKYIKMVKSNPIDVELEPSEVEKYSFRGIFVTTESVENDIYENIKFNRLHQFLQKELIYNDPDKLVRKIGKMMEKRQLTQQQARFLFRSVKPYEQKFHSGLELLEELENEYVGLELEKHPQQIGGLNLNVDAALTHKARNTVFLFDIPYSRKEIKNVKTKLETVKNNSESIDASVYYTIIDTFDLESSQYVSSPREIKSQVINEASIISPEQILDVFKPKIPVEKKYDDRSVEIVAKRNIGFHAKSVSEDDINHKIEIKMPEKAMAEFKNSIMNSRDKFGDIRANTFRLELQVEEDNMISHNNMTEPWSSFRQSVKGIYHSSVNPVLAKTVNTKI